MNREQFNSALNGISDGLVEEAAGAYEKKSNQKRTLLQWAAAGLAEQHRRKTVIAVAAAGLCLAVVLAAAGAIWGGPAGMTGPTQPTISVQNPTTAPTTPVTKPSENSEGSRVVLLSQKNGEKTETPLEVGITTPLDYVVYVRDLRGLDDEKRREVEEEWRKFDRSMHSTDSGIQSTSYIGEEVIVGTYIKGILGITSGRSEISELSVDTINDGIGNYGWGCDANNFHVSWFINPEVLIEDPGIQLSSIRDSLEVTIHYEDGTTEIIIIDFSLNDEGQVFATLVADPLAA